MKTVWIAWEDHRRTKELAKYFNIELFIITSTLPRILKYPLLLFKTHVILFKLRPNIVIIQTPSIILAVFCSVMKYYYNFKLIADLHNAAIIPESVWLKKIHFLYKYAHKKADVNIVTNSNLKEKIETNGNKAIVLPDILPFFAQNNIRPAIVNFTSNYFVSICTFGIDEPFDEIIKAARLLNTNITLIITGNPGKCPVEIKNNLPVNVKLSGYLKESDYVSLLYFSTGIIDLTKRENCLLCGAYEAVSLEKPLILTDTMALKKYFSDGVVFCSNDSQSIAEAITTVNNNLIFYRRAMQKLKKTISTGWQQYEKSIIDIIS